MSIEWEIRLPFDEIADELESRVPIALARGMEYLRSVVTPLVPVETGNLVGSGGITVTDEGAQLYYPGPYALYQHEGVYYRHGRFGATLTHSHGESFFLEGPAIREADTVRDVVARTLFGVNE